MYFSNVNYSWDDDPTSCRHCLNEVLQIVKYKSLMVIRSGFYLYEEFSCKAKLFLQQSSILLHKSSPIIPVLLRLLIVDVPSSVFLIQLPKKHELDRKVLSSRWCNGTYLAIAIKPGPPGSSTYHFQAQTPPLGLINKIFDDFLGRKFSKIIARNLSIWLTLGSAI